MVDVMVQRPIELTMIEVDVKIVPEGSKGAALLGIAGLLLLALPGRIAEGRPLLLRPDLACLSARSHELFHGDGWSMFLHCLNLGNMHGLSPFKGFRTQCKMI